MSLELLDLLRWIAIVFVGGVTYAPLGKTLASTLSLGGVAAYVMAYLMVAALIWLVFTLIRRMAGEKLLGSDTFGGYEYYMGMVAGGVRFLCILIFSMALLNAKPINRTELEKQRKDQIESLGAIYFPPFGYIQQDIFEKSICGQFARQHLAAQFIQVDPKQLNRPRSDTIYRTRQRDVDDAMGRGR